MKISRKMRLQVEGKIRHGLATSALPIVERNSATESNARPTPDKSGGADMDQAK
jgi:hypothetical protein